MPTPTASASYTLITQEDMKDPQLTVLNQQVLLLSRGNGSAQSLITALQQQIAALQAQVAKLQAQVAAFGQPGAPSQAATTLEKKGQAQQSLTAVTTLQGASTPVLPVGKGGTGQNSLNQHGILIGEGKNGVNVIAPGAVGTVLTSQGATSDPDFEDAQLLGAHGLGNGASTNLSAPAQGTGGGPASLAVEDWIEVKVNGTNRFIPLFT